MDGVEILCWDVDTLSSVLIRENRQVGVANHSCQVSGEGGEVTVAFFGCKFIGIVKVVHLGGGGEELDEELVSG